MEGHSSRQVETVSALESDRTDDRLARFKLKLDTRLMTRFRLPLLPELAPELSSVSPSDDSGNSLTGEVSKLLLLCALETLLRLLITWSTTVVQ